MKKISRPQLARVRHIFKMIHEGTLVGEYPNAQDFMRALGVSRATVCRDLDVLRDEEGAPIVYDDLKWGYHLEDTAWKLPPIRLNRGEVFSFSIAQKLLEGFRGTPLEMDMHSLFEKIADSLEGQISISPAALGGNFSVIGDDYVEQDPETWSAVAGAIDRQEIIRVTYQKFNSEVKEYELEPLHLAYYHGNWYLLCRVSGKDRVLTFALSRILQLDFATIFFDPPEQFNPEALLKEAFGIVRGEETFKARLLCKKKIAGYIKERVWHPTQEVRKRRNGDIELRFETAGWKELVRWVLSWQPDMKVIAPKRLRERIDEKMRQALTEEAS